MNSIVHGGKITGFIKCNELGDDLSSATTNQHKLSFHNFMLFFFFLMNELSQLYVRRHNLLALSSAPVRCPNEIILQVTSKQVPRYQRQYDYSVTSQGLI